MEDKIILFFDGDCSFCNKTVQWVIKHNRKANIYFASLQGNTAQKVLFDTKLVDPTIDSLIFYENNKAFMYSNGALKLSKHLNGGWKLLYSLIAIPPFIRNYAYKSFAKRRYRWFGKQDACVLPDAYTRQRFLD